MPESVLYVNIRAPVNPRALITFFFLCRNYNSGKADANHTHAYLPLSGGTVTGNIIANGFLRMTNGNISLFGGDVWLGAGNVTISHASNVNAKVAVLCGDNQGCLQATDIGNFGIKDITNDAYLINRDIDSDVYIMPSSVYTNLNIGSSGLNIYIKGYTMFNRELDIGYNAILGNVSTDGGQSSNSTKLLVINTAGNIHMGNYQGPSDAPVYLHAKGMQYDFLDGSFRPGTSTAVPSGTISLGDGSHRWKQVYAVNGTINTSDRNMKNSIADIDDKRLQLLLNIEPKQFKVNGGDRVHTGLIAQQLEEAMTELGLTAEDVAALCKDAIYDYDINEEDDTEIESSKRPRKDADGNVMYRYGARYEELITPILSLVQILWKKVFGDLSFRRA